MNKKEELYPRFTMLVSNDNLSKVKKENADLYSVLAEKPCVYTTEEYTIIEFLVLSEDIEDLDLESILNEMGGLIIHESGTHSFCMLEEDIDELSRIFTWDNSGSMMMGELLSTEDRIILLEKKQLSLNLKGDIKINIGTKSKEEYIDIKAGINKLFDFEGEIVFGDNQKEEKIWWPFLLDQEGGFNIIIQKEEKEDKENIPNPFDKNDDSNYYRPPYYDYCDDYDDIPAWYRERDW